VKTWLQSCFFKCNLYHYDLVPHPLEAGVFAAVSLDGTATVTTKDGVRLVMRHTGPVCGCAFDPFNPDLLATATKVGLYKLRGCMS
jgi:hypothetical protein